VSRAIGERDDGEERGGSRINTAGAWEDLKAREQRRGGKMSFSRQNHNGRDLRGEDGGPTDGREGPCCAA